MIGSQRLRSERASAAGCAARRYVLRGFPIFGLYGCGYVVVCHAGLPSTYLRLRIYRRAYPRHHIYVKPHMMYTACMAKDPGGFFSRRFVSRAGGHHAAAIAEPDRGPGDLRLLLRGDSEDRASRRCRGIWRICAKAGIVASRREGKWMHYRLTIPKDEVAARILRETLRHLQERPEMKRDVARLSSACCAPQKYVLLQGAPQPGVPTTEALTTKPRSDGADGRCVAKHPGRAQHAGPQRRETSK